MGIQVPQKGYSFLFSAHVCCGQIAASITMSLGMELGLGPGDFVLDGDSAEPPSQKGCVAPNFPLPSPKGGLPPNFRPNVYCGQTTGWIKMPLGTKVDLSPGYSVLMGTQHPPHKRGGAPSPIFGPFLLWPNGWMHQDATWYGGRPLSSPHCGRWGTALLPKKGAEPPPNFRPIFIVAKRLDGCIKMPLGMEVGLGPGNIAQDGTQLPPKGHSPQFSAHVCCGQTLDGSNCHLEWR